MEDYLTDFLMRFFRVNFLIFVLRKILSRFFSFYHKKFHKNVFPIFLCLDRNSFIPCPGWNTQSFVLISLFNRIDLCGVISLVSRKILTIDFVATDFDSNNLFVREADDGALMGHFGIAKKIYIMRDHFYVPHMRKDDETICGRCVTCKQAKSKVQSHIFYIPLPIPVHTWNYIFMECLVFLGQELERILSLLWLIDFLKWHISLYVIRLMIHCR